MGRLVELGLAEDGGPAASRGGRRSTLVDLDAGLRFVGIDLGVTSMRVAVTDGRLGVLARATASGADIRRGPEAVLAEAIELTRKLLAEQGVDRPAGVGIGVPGPVDFHAGVPVSPPIMPGWDGYPVRDVFSRELGAPVAAGQRRQRDGAGRAAHGGRPIGVGVPVRQDRHRDRLRHRRRPAPLPRRRRVRRRHRAHPGRAIGPGVRLRQPGVPGGVLRWCRAGARTPTSAARAGRSAILAEMLEEDGELTAQHVGRAFGRGDAVALQLTRDGGRRVGSVLANLVSFFNPGLIVIGGGVAGLGHTLLAEIRSAIYRQSLPLATGNLPVVLSELGGDAGVIGAARLVSDAVYAAG